MIQENMIHKIQEESNEWRQRNFPDTSGKFLQLAGMVEELGELSHAILKHEQQIREYAAPGRDELLIENAGDAMGDLFIYMCGLASALGIALDVAIDDCWRSVAVRDWMANPQNARADG